MCIVNQTRRTFFSQKYITASVGYHIEKPKIRNFLSMVIRHFDLIFFVVALARFPKPDLGAVLISSDWKKMTDFFGQKKQRRNIVTSLLY